jgi:hypothetical protein
MATTNDRPVANDSYELTRIFEVLVRCAIGNEKTIQLGNTTFWFEEDSLVYNLPTVQWKEVSQALAARLTLKEKGYAAYQILASGPWIVEGFNVPNRTVLLRWLRKNEYSVHLQETGPNGPLSSGDYFHGEPSGDKSGQSSAYRRAVGKFAQRLSDEVRLGYHVSAPPV